MGAALYSPCRTWRYLLRRDFPAGAGTVTFVMLNPSTADAARDDPTVRRCVGYARRWGYRTLLVTNAFAYRATDPRVLKAAPDPVGPENDRYLVAAAGEAELVVAAWGIHGAHAGRDRRVRDLLAPVRLTHLGLTAAGQPRHPLYLRLTAMPQSWLGATVPPGASTTAKRATIATTA